MTTDEMLAEARAHVEHFGKHLPTVVDPAGISLRAKIPFNALCAREGLLWRIEELGRAACDCYGRRDVVAAIVLTRAVVECAAALWHLMELVDHQVSKGIESDLHQKVLALLLGQRLDPSGSQAVNVLTMLGRINKAIPGVSHSYDLLSEYAHPNWSGTAGSYSEIDREQVLTKFGRGLRNPDRHYRVGLSGLNGALGLFEYSYGRIGDLMPAFVQCCEAALDRGAHGQETAGAS